MLALVVGAIVGGFNGWFDHLMKRLFHLRVVSVKELTIALSYASTWWICGCYFLRLEFLNYLSHAMLRIVKKDGEADRTALGKVLVVLMLLAMAIFSQNLIPIHIAFIPLLVPPILHVLNMLK